MWLKNSSDAYTAKNYNQDSNIPVTSMKTILNKESRKAGERASDLLLPSCIHAFLIK